METIQAQTVNSGSKLQDILARLTLEEKIGLLSGLNGGQTKPIPRLGIPSLNVIDGPVGIGWGRKSICFPCGAALGATWNPEIVEQVGRALAVETRAAGCHVLLAPCVNIQRHPLAGRNFESFSEDPYLTGILATAYVRGLQKEGIGASLKHFACNNQEWERLTISVEVSERALREIYLPHFERVVREADPWTVMAAYNKLRGEYCTANRYLLTDILKTEWGYQGVVVSDWGATHDVVGPALAGLDLEMPGPGKYFGPALIEAVEKGQVPIELINDKVLRLLRLLDRAGLLGGTTPSHERPLTLTVEERKAISQRAAEEAMVLLKNDSDVLPLDPARTRRLAVIGPNADVFRTGGGSAFVYPISYVTPLEGIRAFAGDRFEVVYEEGTQFSPPIRPIPSANLRPPEGYAEPHGLLGEYFANSQIAGSPTLKRVDSEINFDWGEGAPDPSLPNDGFSIRWSGYLVPTESGLYEIGMTTDDGFRLYVDDELVIERWRDQWPITTTTKRRFAAGRSYKIRVEYYENKGRAVAKLGWRRADRIQAAAQLARTSDAAVVVVGLSDEYDTENTDRKNMDLPGEQDELIQAVAAANPKTIVVMVAGSPVTMEKWIDKVPALLWAWYPGQEIGKALARILFGEVNPSGKLPTTLPKRLEDNPAYKYYPGENGVVRYEEGIYVGYRHYDTRNVNPRFCFGHGLSYTTFRYTDLNATLATHGGSLKVKVSFSVTNTGKRLGAEVAQLYVRDVECSVDRPFKELKAFKKVFLQPGEIAEIEFELGPDAFAFWHPTQNQWVVEPGVFEILVGSSSRDIRLRTHITIP